jgi:beta-glucosidase
MLSFTGPEGRRMVEPGEIELQAGVSSAEIALRTTIALTGEIRTLSGRWRMESRCQVER